jgi:hypothetical protein
MEDSETKTAALEKVAELEDELGHVSVLLLNIKLVCSHYIRSSMLKLDI